jgi:hypothetical protein
MALKAIPDNLRLHADKMLDDRQGPWPSIDAALAGVTFWRRSPGLEVYIAGDGWYAFSEDKTELIRRLPEAPNEENQVYLRGSLQWVKGVTLAAFDSFAQWVAEEFDSLWKPTVDGDGTKYLSDNGTYKTVEGGGGGGSLPPTSPDAVTYGENKIKQYITYPDGKFKDCRVEYTEGIATKIEIQDTLKGEFVRKTLVWENGRYKEGPVTTITAFTITI